MKINGKLPLSMRSQSKSERGRDTGQAVPHSCCKVGGKRKQNFQSLLLTATQKIAVAPRLTLSLQTRREGALVKT